LASPCAFLYTRWKYGLDIERISPEDAVGATQIPIFLIQGQLDNNIPIRHSTRILARTQKAVLWVVPYAGHSSAIGTAAEELERRLIDCFALHSLPPRPNQDSTGR
jgi:pimeloyl-ACP methyl ester carboxylesterase